MYLTSYIKPYVKPLLCAAVFAVFAAVTGLNAAAAAGTVKGDAVNVRKDPSTSAEIVDKLMNGQTLDVLSIEGDWLRVNTPATSGAFVNKQFVALSAADALVTADDVNVRGGASTSTNVLGKLSAGASIRLTEANGDFYAFDYNGKTGYIHKDFVVSPMAALLPVKVSAPAVRAAAPQVAVAEEPVPQAAPAPQAETTYALVVSENGVNLRSAPDTASPVIAVLTYNEAADVIETGEEWNKVSYYGAEGFISAEFSVVKTGVKPDNSVRTAIVNFAKQYLGTRYVWGGTSLTNGVDCSGFTYSVFKAFGVALHRSSHEQVSNGPRVSKGELLPGDLVFFATSGGSSVSHVGIYIGGGQFIHASSSNSSHKVTISSLYEDYYARTYVSACRVL